jgi:hypothetical protein
MIMQDQSKRLSEPLNWGSREKSVVGALLACAVVAVLVLGVYGLTSGSPARADCIDVTFAGTLGASKIHACGGHAKTICASSAGYKGLEELLRPACREAGFAYGRR